MGLFKDMLRDSESLFINEMALDIEYMPEIIKYRENQQQYIATCIKPLLQNRNGKNLFITGSPGIGKTVATRFILNELNKETDDVKTIYINCWNADTGFKMANEMCGQLDYKWVHNKHTDDLLKEAAKIINKSAAVIVLDEIDKLKEPEVIYTLLEDINRKCIFLITNEEDLLSELDLRIRSRLMPEMLKFKPYTYNEVEGILKQRVDYAFVKNIWKEDAFKAIVDKTYEAEDIRTGLYLMKEAGLLAERDSVKSITKKHAEMAIEKLGKFKIKKSSDMDGEEKELLKLIELNSGKQLSEIYELYKGKNNKSYRTFRRKIEQLKKGRLIYTIDEIGKPSIIKYGNKKLSDF
ncbi:MAG: AAA family ATPase [Nanoarchaeota archaeon]